MNGAGTLRLQYKALCQENYYGTACDILCQPADSDTLGHYTCGSNGNKICNDGWSDPPKNCLVRKLATSYFCQI